MAIQTVKTGAAVNDGTGDDARTAFTKINDNFANTTHAANKIVGVGPGQIPLAQDVASAAIAFNPAQVDGEDFTAPFAIGRLFSAGRSTSAKWIPVGNDAWALFSSYRIINGTFGTLRAQQAIGNNASLYLRTGYDINASAWVMFYSTGNTTKDSNGFLKGASPIVKLFADKIELNDEAQLQQITFEKLGVGDYLIKGSTGFSQEGWYIETPKDANGNVLVAAVYEQLDNNDISVKTYDYMLNKKGRIVPDLETPLDIPETRWIDLRLQELPQDDAQPLSEDETVNTNAE